VINFSVCTSIFTPAQKLELFQAEPFFKVNLLVVDTTKISLFLPAWLLKKRCLTEVILWNAILIKMAISPSLSVFSLLFRHSVETKQAGQARNQWNNDISGEAVYN